MLEIVPLEILQEIVSHLPTASSLVNLSLTSQTLHKKLSKDKYEIFRLWVLGHFPSVEVPPFWRESAAVLTARSRAWERRAFVARECDPNWYSPAQAWTMGPRAPTSAFGFVPVIDSYECWTGSRWADKKEVLAWGAAGRLIIRRTESGKVRWTEWMTPRDHMSDNDILDVHLLRPHQNRNTNGESFVVRRADDSLVKVASSAKDHVFDTLSTYDTTEVDIDCMDVSNSADPIIAVCDTETIRLFPAISEASFVTPSTVLQMEQRTHVKHRKRCARFLSMQRLAVSTQFLEGRAPAPIHVYDLTSTGLTQSTWISSDYALDGSKSSAQGRICANAMIPLTGTGGEIFLSGWSDGITRLYDLRAPLVPRMEYHDSVDDGQILSLLAIGHERFLAGSHQNACLKTFDMRMPGAMAYSYLDGDARAASRSSSTGPVTNGRSSKLQPFVPHAPSRRDINIFLALTVHRTRRLWQPLPRWEDARLPRYRGSIYTLSAPSSCSPTVYCGIENHVIQLDFVSTDDARNNNLGVTSVGLNLPDKLHRADETRKLSCYERPRAGHESDDPVLLRKQVDYIEPRQPGRIPTHKDANSCEGAAEKGWDERWRLAQYDRQGNLESGGGWRHVPPT